MSCTNEFGIIDSFDRTKNYGLEYEVEKYHCISLDDEIINQLIKPLSVMKTYFHSFNRATYGLDHWGVTIIPPESLNIFYNILVSQKRFRNSGELNELAALIIEAKSQNKYMIHYGI